MKFEKVSFKQYLSDHTDGMHDLILDEYDSLRTPKRATMKSAGYDFFAPYTFTLAPGQTEKIPSGIRVLLDDDKVLMCYPRSGLGFKYRLQLDNSVAIIDADYADSDNEGHIFFKVTNDSRSGKSVTIKRGDAFAQGIIMQYFTTEDDYVTATRNGGFGSTNK